MSRHTPRAGYSQAGPFRSLGLLAAFALAVPTWISAAATDAVAADAAPAKPTNDAPDKVLFNRSVRPILAENCFRCHGPDSAARKADLRLDRREVAIAQGAIVAGKPEESGLIDRIFSTKPSEVMPPPSSHRSLSSAQKDVLRRWIASGAEYQPHWSLVAPVRPQPAVVKGQAWVRNPIDRFVLAALEQRGLQPAPEADRRTLARRVSLDLIGLPPSPAIVEAFVNDPAANAYENLVDRLLQSRHWGEHRARYWLDAARYADTHGIHFDNYREMWSYRDWVIDALNRNQPFDEFTLEQLAGDLLPSPTLEQRVATGFNRSHMTTNEGGVIAEEYLVLYTRDRTETTARVWMGITAGCAVCHDHKFDPLSQKEFYQLSAFFNNTSQGAMDGNVKDTAPTALVPSAADRRRWPALTQELADTQKATDARKTAARADFDKWLIATKPESLAALVPTESLRLHARLSEAKGNAVRVDVDGRSRTVQLPAAPARRAGHVAADGLVCNDASALQVAEAGDFERSQGFSCGAWVRIGRNGGSGAIVARMNDGDAFRGWDLWLEDRRLGMHLIHQWPNDAIKVVANVAIEPDQWRHLLVTYDGSQQAGGLNVYVDGKPQPTGVQANSLKGTIRTNVPLKLARRHTGSRLDDTAIQDLRIYGRALSAAEVAKLVAATRAVWLATKPAADRTDAEKNELYPWWLSAVDRPYRDLKSRGSALEQEEAAIRSRATAAHVMQERREAPTAYVLYRGDYDKRRDRVQPKTPDFLPKMPSDLPKDRLGLARWLMRAENPLTARVTVNRFWQEVFGMGLVRTSEDFGLSGEPPSHPELLDWLAVEFRESGWDVKKLFRLLVTSAAYRQSSVVTPEKLERDPQDRLVSRGPRFRMDAEMIRDHALAAGGLLVPKIGGPSVKPYQPDGVWEAVAMMESNTRIYQRDHGENLYRRSLYTFWKRAAPPALMDIFNAPSRELCTVRRDRTSTPLQALATLNDPQFVEAAKSLAQNALQRGGPTPQSRLEFVALHLLARPLRPEESRPALDTVVDLLRHYRAHPDAAKALLAVGELPADPALDAPTLAAWTMLANQLMNLDEVLNK